MTPLHTAARDYANRGIPVFPCVPGAKKPLCANGFHDATTDPAQIDAWWAAWPDANVAFSPHSVGLGIVDLDGSAGEDAWLDVQIEHAQAPLTYTVATPRGGRHLYFLGELPPSQSKVGPHIDTRGKGSYALLPPSRLTDWPEPYRIVDPRDPVATPEWVATAIGKARERAKATVDDLDQPHNISRARSLLEGYVRTGHVAVEGEMGDARTFAVACEIMNLGVSEDTALELLDTVWNPACQPPWDRDELEIKVSNAASYAQNEPGAWATPPPQDVFGPVLDRLGIKADEAAAGTYEFQLYSVEEIQARPKPKWLIPNLVPERGLVMLYGESGSYKTFLALDLALSLASGVERFGAQASEGQKVIYLAGEGPTEVAQERIPPWRMLTSGGTDKFKMLETMPFVILPEKADKFIADTKAQGWKPALVVIDTYSRLMSGLDENQAKDGTLFITFAEKVKRELDTAVLVIHHGGKDTSRGARGSNVLQAGIDVSWEIDADKTDLQRPVVQMTCRKMKNAIEPQPMHFQGAELGGCLVFSQITAAEVKATKRAADGLDPRKIGAALVELGARGEEHAVTTAVLAAHLIPERETEEPEDRQDKVEKVARALRARATGGLEAYCEGKGHGLKWSVPVA